MFGNSFYNPYMYQPYYQAANTARNLSGMAGASNLGRVGSSLASRNMMGNAIGNAGGNLTGLGKNLLGKFSFSSFLNGASKTLNVVNQAIPIFYQVRPMINNAKTMFRIIGAVRDDDSPKDNTKISKNVSSTSTDSSNDSAKRLAKDSITTEHETLTENPIFFI